jgi:hypothetical protein
MASYTLTESQEISGMPGSAASSAYQGLASVDGPNFLTLQRSQYVVPDKISANVSYYIDLIGGLQLDLYYTGYSAYGNSFTYSNDMNGDGLATDLIYIPATKDEVAFTSEADRDAFLKFVEQDSYLSTHKGQYAEANAARAPFVHRFDLRVAKDIKFHIGSTSHKFQLSASIDNIGNMFNSKWGVRRLDCYNKNSFTGFISPLAYDSKTDTFSFNKVGDAYPTETYSTFYKNASECWRVLFGLKYYFN